MKGGRVAFVIVALATGCTLLTDLDGLSGGATDVPDAPLTDTSAPVDQGNGSPVDAGRCQGLDGPAKLCVDFSDRQITNVSKTTTDFDSIELNASNPPALDDVIFGDAAPAARFDYFSDGGEVAGFLGRSYPDTVSHVLIAANMRIERNVASSMDLIEVRFGNPFTETIYIRYESDGSLTLRQAILADGSDSTTPYAIGVNVDIGEWRHLSLDIDRVASRAKIEYGAKPFVVSFAPHAIPPGVRFIAGVTGSRSGGKVWIDDVVADFR